MFTTLFWKLAAERAVKTFAQTLAAVLVASGAGMFEADWRSAASAAAMAALVSVLTSVGSSKIGPPDSPSMVGPAPAPDRAPSTGLPVAPPTPLNPEPASA